MKAKRHLLPAVAAMLFLTEASAQSLQSSMEFLKYPVSAHQAALGGQAVSAADRSASQFLANPALLSEVESGMVGLNAMTWIGNTVIAGAQYGNSLGERTMYGFSARYVDYGSSARTLPDATVTGTFSSKDMAVGISCSYMFTDNLSGGATGNLIFSHYASMTAASVGIDLGLYWNNPDKGLSLAIAARNLGGQIKAFENEFQRMPFDLTAGISWKMEHSPLRLTATLDGLTDWDEEDFYFPDGHGAGKGQILRRHFSFGADFMLTDCLYVAGGCNLRTRDELSGDGSKGLTGFSAGTGLRLSRMSFDLSVGKYQISHSSMVFNFAFRL